MQVNKASSNLDDLDLNPLFVQADHETIKDIAGRTKLIKSLKH